MKSKQSARNKKQPIVVKDLKAKNNPKGGASDIFAKIGDIKGSSLPAAKGSSAVTYVKYEV